MIKLVCSKCGKKLEAPDKAAGGKGKCPYCGEVFVVPVGQDIQNESIQTKETSKDMKKCPYCAEDIGKEALKCKHCSSDVGEQAQEADRVKIRCGKCDHRFSLPQGLTDKEARCPNCGMLFDIPSEDSAKPKAKKPPWWKQQIGVSKTQGNTAPQLIPCPSCKKEISEAAQSCPGCGYDFAKEKKAKDDEKSFKSCGGCLGVVIILVIIIAFLHNGGSSNPRDTNAWKTEDNKSMAYVMMENFVKDRLKAPATAEFPGVFDGKIDHVTSLGDLKYKIVSYVDAQNSFGAKIRTRFIGVIQQISEDEWRLISLDLIE